MRKFPVVSAALLASLVALGACARPGVEGGGRAAARRWNVVWIVADDMSPDTGAYGDSWAETPNLDCLAAEGTRFLHAIANSPVCAPARATLHTGMYATSIGAHQMRSWAVPPPYVRPFAELLRRAGYYTSNNQKIDWNFNPHLETDVARAVREPPLGPFDASGPQAHWRDREPGQPFFAVFDLFVTHESRIRLPDEAFAELTAELTATDRHPGPLRVSLSCSTEGSAILYTTTGRAEAPWRLYTGPIELAASTRLRFQAGRLGFFDSEEVAVDYEIDGR